VALRKAKPPLTAPTHPPASPSTPACRSAGPPANNTCGDTWAPPPPPPTPQVETGALPRPGHAGDASKLLELVDAVNARSPQDARLDIDDAARGILRKFASGEGLVGAWWGEGAQGSN
jgi:hypothetical protein